MRGIVALYDSLSLGIKALGISANIGLEETDVGDSETQLVEAGEQTSEAAAQSPEAAGRVSATVAPAAATVAPAADTVGESVDTVGRGADATAQPLGFHEQTPQAMVASAVATAEMDSSVSSSEEGSPDDVTPVGAKEAPAKEQSAFGFKELAVTVIVSLGLAVGLFVVIPLVVVKTFESTFSNPFVFNLVEGVIRIFIFLLYIVGISLIPDLRRVFQYHGAEHKVIHAYEHCGRPDAEEARQYKTLHPRCGTGFLFVVMVIAILLFAFVGKPSLPYLVLSRIIGIPIIIGIAYEVGIKWAGRHPDGPVTRVLLWPGLQLQRLTTREPSDDQLEVAAAALEEVMALDASSRTVEETAPATT